MSKKILQKTENKLSRLLNKVLLFQYLHIDIVSLPVQVNKDLEASAMLKWCSEGGSSSLVLGGKYQLDKDTSCKVCLISF